MPTLPLPYIRTLRTHYVSAVVGPGFSLYSASPADLTHELASQVSSGTARMCLSVKPRAASGTELMDGP